MHDEVLESQRLAENHECSRLSASKNRRRALLGIAEREPDVAWRHVHPGGTRPCVRLPAEPKKATGELSIRQTNYDIKVVSAVGRHNQVKDELKLSFEMTARGQDSLCAWQFPE